MKTMKLITQKQIEIIRSILETKIDKDEVYEKLSKIVKKENEDNNSTM
jgi:hypothetical protein